MFASNRVLHARSAFEMKVNEERRLEVVLCKERRNDLALFRAATTPGTLSRVVHVRLLSHLARCSTQHLVNCSLTRDYGDTGLCNYARAKKSQKCSECVVADMRYIVRIVIDSVVVVGCSKRCKRHWGLYVLHYKMFTVLLLPRRLIRVGRGRC